MPDVQKLLQDSVQAHFFPLPSLLPAKDFCHTEALQEPLPIPYCHNNENVVLEKGQIIERGSHDELIEQKGRYYQLYTGQFELE